MVCHPSKHQPVSTFISTSCRHEAEYNKCKGYMIQSSEFKKELKKEMGNMNFVLCTMGMLFSDKLESLGLFRTIPMERLVVDEASQIFVGDYLVSQ